MASARRIATVNSRGCYNLAGSFVGWVGSPRRASTRQEATLPQDSADTPALTRLFSPAIVRELATTGRSPAFARLLRGTSLATRSDVATVGHAFDEAFSILKRTGHRDEYVYRTALTQKILLGTHSLRTASMVTEFRAGSCKADVVILNGTATAWEIKSERDSLTRLRNQLENYPRVFAAVNVIASEAHLMGVLAAAPRDIGVWSLSKRYQLTPIRQAHPRPERTSPDAIFESLRSSEAKTILEALGVTVPVVPNTQLRTMLAALFRTADPVQVHFEMVRTLKRTRSLAPLGEVVSKLPRSLHAAVLSTSIRRTDRAQLVASVQTPLSSALAWS